MKKIIFLLFILLTTELYAQDVAETEFIASYFKNRKEKINYRGKIYDYEIKRIEKSLAIYRYNLSR